MEKDKKLRRYLVCYDIKDPKRGKNLLDLISQIFEKHVGIVPNVTALIFDGSARELYDKLSVCVNEKAGDILQIIHFDQWCCPVGLDLHDLISKGS